MTRRRWIADEFSGDRAALTGAHAAHLSRTLRARLGQEFEVACGEVVRRATVSSVADDRVEFALGEEVSASAAVPITLLLAVFKFDRMEWAIEKCTELNVTRIVPVIARRTEKYLGATAEKRVERWQRIAREASEQSRRATPPEISAPVRLKEAISQCSTADIAVQKVTRQSRTELGSNSIAEEVLKLERHRGGTEVNVGHEIRAASSAARQTGPRRGETEASPGREPWVGPPNEPSPVGTAQENGGISEDAYPANLRIVLSESECTPTLTDVLHSHESVDSLTLAIGPEGGWTLEELHSFEGAQWTSASLGNTILRTETAAIAALAIARAEI